MDLTKKVALITGAARGIGAGIARYMAEHGARLALVDVDGDALRETAAGLPGEPAACFAGSVVDDSFVTGTVAATVERFGALDILVNNAGIIRDNFLAKITEEDWDAVLAVNLKGPFLISRAVFPHMKERRQGKIVNIISRAWLGNIGQGNYSASKGGLVSLTRTMALEFARYQINVNGVAPGLIDTPMTRGMPEKARERLIRMQPTGKMGTVDDIAAAVAFLASDEAGFITGQILHVDGGKSCGLLSL